SSVICGVGWNLCFFFQAEDGIRDWSVTGVQTCALPIFAEHRPRRVLDVGWGDGEFAEWCARRLTVEVVTVDQSVWLAEHHNEDRSEERRVGKECNSGGAQ